MIRLLNWLDDRTGIRDLTHAALYEHIPGGARWRYVWGSTLLFTFAVQMITGFFLWTAYSPSSQTAWESVYYIQHQMTGGAVLRGIHHYTAQVMIILLGLHMLQVIIDGAYRAPREVNFWIGIVLLNLVLAISLSGYLLPWDQKGYWSTQVATSLLASVPVVGPSLQRLVIGGPDYGHHTLTRFFAVHAGLLPVLMMAFIGAHVYVFRRHGLRHKLPARGETTYFWPDQLLKDSVACLGVLLVILLLVFRFAIIPGGSDQVGAELSAPADASEPFGAARPEWYFLFLFQFLKLPFFSAENEVYGAVVIPGLIMFVLVLMPLIGRWRVGHGFNVAFTMFLAAGMILLTLMAVLEDQGGPQLNAPMLAKVGPGVSAGMLAALALVALILVPLFARERSFRFNVIVLGALLVLVGLLLVIAMAGGGPALAGPVVRGLPAQRVLLLSLLALLVLVFTVALFRDYPHAPDMAHIGRWEWHHRTRLGLLLAVIVATMLLTAQALVGSKGKPDYQASVASAKRDAERVVELASGPTGIPEGGAVYLLRADPYTQGPKLFASHCANCHWYGDDNGAGARPTDPPSAANLERFATREWISGLFDPAQADSENYFGPLTKAHKGDMVEFVKEDVAKFKPEEKAQLEKVIKALSAEAKLRSQAALDAADAAEIAEGRKLFGDDGLACTDCHTFHDDKGKGGPNLTGYGSREWIVGIISNPAHAKFYGKDNDRMPAFGDDKLLTQEQIGLLADWLREEWYEPGSSATTQRAAAVTRPTSTQPAE